MAVTTMPYNVGQQRQDYLAVIASLELDALADGNERAEVEEFGDEGVVVKAIPSGRDVIVVKTVTGNVIRTKTIKVLPEGTAAPGRLQDDAVWIRGRCFVSWALGEVS